MKCHWPRFQPLSLLLALAWTPVLANVNYLERKPATPATMEAQQTYRQSMPDDHGRDARWAMQGFIATAEDPVTRNANGDIVYDPTATGFLNQGEAPDTVNPGLWRHHRLLGVHGLFKVAEGIWQVRGIDCTNITFIEGDTGWVVLDPGLNTETAAKVKALVDQHLGVKPVSAVIYSHSHVDHFGGIKGVLGDQAVLPPIYAPEHFIEESSSEWVMAGNVTTRRSLLQWAPGMPHDPQGFVGTGLSNYVPVGTISLIPPDHIIKHTGEIHEIDGIALEFQMVPETEAPAEMNIFIPSANVLYIAEFATASMHNIQTPRGAKARDAASWAGFLTEALDLYGDKSQALIFGHTWPRFGQSEIRAFLQSQRDNYKFIHDQTVRLMNMGLTPTEIAEQLQPPPALQQEWSNHGFYGTYKHNAKGVFQYYVGWWDGNPASLDALPPENQARLYLDVMGGSEAVLLAAQGYFDKGKYREVTELVNNVIFVEPDNIKARNLQADSYEQLGYQAESAVWRNIYLAGAAELRGKPSYKDWLASPDLINSMSPASFMNLLATKLNPAVIGTETMTLDITITDKQENAYVEINNAVMVTRIGQQRKATDIAIAGPQPALLAFFLADLSLDEAAAMGMSVSGDLEKLARLQLAIEKPSLNYNVVVP
jgi:linear primary-alkylsulfatase